MSDDSEIPALGLPSDITFDPQFPPLPRTLAEVTRLLDEEDSTSVNALKEIVRADPVVAPLVLRRVNSAYYGLRRHVTQLDKAIVLLGFGEVYDIVETASLIQLEDLFESEESITVFYQILRNSIGTAAFARFLARYVDLGRSRYAYTAGLLHSVGQLVLLYNVADSYEGLWWSDEGLRAPSPEEEEAIYGSSYADIGATAADQWSFPKVHVAVIQYHVNPEAIHERREWYPLALIVRAAMGVRSQLLQGSRPDESNPTGRWPYNESLKRLAEMQDVALFDVQRALRGQANEVEAYTKMALQE